jgi:hypothetical protein
MPARAETVNDLFFEQFQAQPADKPALNTAIPRSGIIITTHVIIHK